MEFISILSSVSKIAIVAFVITFSVVIYEVYLISRKDDSKKNKKVTVPEFSNGTIPKSKVADIKAPKSAAVKLSEREQFKKKLIQIVGFTTVLIVLGGGGFYIYKNYFPAEEEVLLPPIQKIPQIKQETAPEPSPTIELAQSFGFEDEGIDLMQQEPTVEVEGPTITGSVTIIPTSSTSPPEVESTTPVISKSQSESLTPSQTPTDPPAGELTPTSTDISASPTHVAPSRLPQSGIINTSVLFLLIALSLITFSFVI